jgi:hypothetical protein
VKNTIISFLASVALAVFFLIGNYETTSKPIPVAEPTIQLVRSVPLFATSSEVEHTPPLLELHGIVQSSAAPLALLKNAQRVTVGYAVGEQVEDGWVLQRIETDKVLISKGTSRVTLRLDSTPRAAIASQGAASGVVSTSTLQQLEQADKIKPMMVSDEQARENNRVFLEALNARRASLDAPH